MSYKSDMHIHSWFSDGTLSPADIVKKYSWEEYGIISITDHETTEGIEQARLEGEKADLKVVTGIELPALYREKELHILGYYFDPADRALSEKLRFLAVKRKERNEKLLAALIKKGFDISGEDLLKREGQTYTGKPDFARALVKKGYVRSVADAFSPGKFLEDPEIKKIKKYKMPAGEAIELIRGAKGIPVLAHPCKIKGIGERGSAVFRENFDSLLRDLKKAGLGGLECIYPKHTEEERFFFIDEASRYHLHITEGSDFHGDR